MANQRKARESSRTTSFSSSKKSSRLPLGKRFAIKPLTYLEWVSLNTHWQPVHTILTFRWLWLGSTMRTVFQSSTNRLWRLSASKESSRSQWGTCSCVTQSNGAPVKTYSAAHTQNTSATSSSTRETLDNSSTNHSKLTTGTRSRILSSMRIS